jgi:hypothetical protein
MTTRSVEDGQFRAGIDAREQARAHKARRRRRASAERVSPAGASRSGRQAVLPENARDPGLTR